MWQHTFLTIKLVLLVHGECLEQDKQTFENINIYVFLQMLLNSFAQPTLLTKQNTNLNFKEFKNAPLLLCHANALEGKLLPQDWSGTIYGSEDIINAIKEKKFKLNLNNSQILKPNEIYNINISEDDFQGKVKQMELIMIPWDKQYVMYLIKTDNVVSLLTDLISENNEVFVQNKTLRNTIKSGIDILYINDGIYSNSLVFKEYYPKEFLLGALATLIRPRYIQGLTWHQQLPQHLLNCCLNSNIL